MIVEYTRYKIDEARQKVFEKDYAEAAKSLRVQLSRPSLCGSYHGESRGWNG